ncbi:hypothetical protein OHT57_23925 [Streptomyces sp. NBC_00285]|uniref:hypothetical protein n=1 Tax=Streptomyces sp. NBC_00285 TaxID=2975700 RepID=UPI002E29FF5E|nr:hypothetical protein [Streptomyces sp. NBC_00285]
MTATTTSSPPKLAADRPSSSSPHRVSLVPGGSGRRQYGSRGTELPSPAASLTAALLTSATSGLLGAPTARRLMEEAASLRTVYGTDRTREAVTATGPGR